ncbi:unnamed protein product, partial [Meganyctiphanes norvegica]
GCDDLDSLDGCDRNEVRLNGACYQVLSQGPCDLDELVLVDFNTRKGYCAPRLCNLDRVFLFGTQQCHDPREPGFCPPGRILYTSQFGTPVCVCPDGYYEKGNNTKVDICEPILSEIDSCPKGEVFWFKTFHLPPLCRSDPCNGLNLNRPKHELPYVPSLKDGKCYQIGSQPNICRRPDEYYAVNMVKLKGVCVRLDDAGYTIYSAEELANITSLFGPRIPKDATSKFLLTPAHTNPIPEPLIASPVVPVNSVAVTAPLKVGTSVVTPLNPLQNLIPDSHHSKPLNLSLTHVATWSPSYNTVNGSLSSSDFSGMAYQLARRRRSAQHSQRLHRQRRSPRPFATPGNVFEPRLSTCKAGASKDLNAKCRHV